jgi:hypothetical protein
MNEITDQIASTDTLNAVSSLPGMNNLE